MPHDPLIAAIRDALAARANLERASGQQRYMKSAMPYLGLTTAELRAALRPVLADPAHRLTTRRSWEATIRTLWDDATHREHRYAAIAVARHRTAAPFRTLDAVPLYRHLIVTGAWWDLVDDIATHLVRELILAHPETEAARMRTWAREPGLWLRRTAIICQVGARTGTDRDLLASTITPNLEREPSAGPAGRQDFFIRKGIGWALRDYAYADPAWVRAFVDTHRDRMAGLSIREATKHL